MAVLHVVSRSPWASSSLRQCACRMGKGDALILIRDSVYASLGDCESAKTLAAMLTEGLDCYCLSPDLETRGVSAADLLEGVKTVDYGGFVDLVASFPRSCAW